MRILFFSLMMALAPAFVFSGGGKETRREGGPLVTASTSWTAALALAAGADQVRVLAPAALRHPPEYELKPSDLAAASKADLIVYAGWEIFAKRLAETAGSAGVPALIVETVNTPESLVREAGKIAAVLGTAEACETWAVSFLTFAEGVYGKISSRYLDRRAVVHSDQAAFAAWLGFDIIGIYGPAEPSPALLAELARLKPALVIDNYHDPSGEPIADAAKAAYAQLINFPGKDGTRTLEDVFTYNAAVLAGAAP